MSLFTVANPTWSICDISLWLYPLLQSFALYPFAIVPVAVVAVLDFAVP
jgi:hypothetical protein